MAFNTNQGNNGYSNTNHNNQNFNDRGNGSGNRNDDNWKAVGFLNFYLPAKDGTRVKLGMIPLKEAKLREKQLADWLNENPEENVKILLSKLQCEYGSAEPSDAKGFDLM